MFKDIDKWLSFLNPENLKGNLISIALFIAFYESFEDSIIDHVKYFFHTGFKDKVDTFSPQYQTHVLSKDKKVFKASLLWLQDQEAINEEDIIKILEIIDYRNTVTHEMMDLLFNGVSQNLPKYFANLIAISIKFEKWWTLNIEIPTNPDLEIEKEITENDIITATEMLYRIINDMLSNDEKSANYYRNEFLKYKIHKN
jgi:hypothetical protein